MKILHPGKQYSTLIDPLLNKAHSLASSMIELDANVIDIACGNGTLALKHATRASRVTGIDLSEEMIQFASDRAEEAQIGNIEFIAMDANDLSRFHDKQFDFATISMAIHQFRLEEGMKILTEMKRTARHILIVDYAFPLPGGFSGFATRAIERIAGIEHNRNFKSYLNFGGLPAILTDIFPEQSFQIQKAGSVFEIASI